MITSKEGNGEVLQISDTHIVEVRPEESKAIKHISVGVCKVFGINTIRDNKELDEVIQPVVGVLFVSHDLIDSFTDVNTATLQFNLNQRKTVHENCHIITIDIFTDNGCLVGYLENILGVVIVKERKINLCAILALQHELITENLCALENRLSEHEIKDTLPFFVSQRCIKFCSIKGFKLNFEVFH